MRRLRSATSPPSPREQAAVVSGVDARGTCLDSAREGLEPDGGGVDAVVAGVPVHGQARVARPEVSEGPSFVRVALAEVRFPPAPRLLASVCAGQEQYSSPGGGRATRIRHGMTRDRAGSSGPQRRPAAVNETPQPVNVVRPLRLCRTVGRVRPSFEQTFRAEYAAVVRTVAPIVGSTADAEALTQDAFAKAFVRWWRVGDYDRPGAWIRRVAIRDAVRFAERSGRTAPAPAEAEDPGDGVARRVDVERALGALTPNQRACTVLHHLAGWPVADVSDALGCSEPTVRVHLHRARKQLASALSNNAEEISDGR